MHLCKADDSTRYFRRKVCHCRPECVGMGIMQALEFILVLDEKKQGHLVLVWMLVLYQF